jgi:NAD+ synthetase
MNVLMAQLNYQIADIEGNTQKILYVINQYGQEVDLIVFTELCITGYYPKDLLYQKGLIQAQNEAIAQLQAATEGLRAGVILGYVEQNSGTGKPYFNALGLYERGKQVVVCHKQLLPVYNIFDEARHFEPGTETGVIEFRGQKLGFLICEDGWENSAHPMYKRNPVKDLELAGVDTIISINASPGNIGKQEQRYQLIAATAQRCNANLVYVNQVGGMDDIVFDGGSIALNAKGETLAQSRFYEEDLTLVDLANAPVISTKIQTKMEVIAQQLKLGLLDYCSKTGFDSVVIGSSGGIDSAVTIALAVWALGADKVMAITMPSPFSSEGSWADSEVLCENLGIPLINAPIREQFQLDCAEFERRFGERPSGLTQENMQARTRAKILMAYSNHFGNLVLSTGNKSEISVGYCTLYGDMGGGLSLIGDLYKMEVYALARYLNESVFQGKGIPMPIIEKEPSAELSPDQKDSDSLPSYPILDAILHYYIEEDYLTEQEKISYQDTLSKVDSDTINKVRKMVSRAEYKRQQAAPVIRVHHRAFGLGRQIPLTSKIF